MAKLLNDSRLTGTEACHSLGAISDPITLSKTLVFYITVDGNGNVTEYVDANGAVKAHYEYGPFGEITASSGDKKGTFTHRFSTKPYEAETGILRYQLRDYLVELARFMSHDPIGEDGGLMLYGFVGNEPVSAFDALGLTDVTDIIHQFWFRDIKLWVMGENDEYTQRVRSWDTVELQMKVSRFLIAHNCDDWAQNHKTTPEWKPMYTGSHFAEPQVDPNVGDVRRPRHPAGTAANDARWDYISWWLEGGEDDSIPDNLWYSAVGSFNLYVTVDEIDCCKRTAKLNVWMWNAMTRESFNLANRAAIFRHWPFTLSTQYMWWNWKEEISWDPQGKVLDGASTAGGGGNDGGGEW